jgi:putative ABC transport system permease protein
VLAGVCRARAPFTSLPIVYTRYSNLTGFVPRGRNLMSFVLAKPEPGVAATEVCRRIREATGRLALTREQFFFKTVGYFLSSTGIPVNFGITISLGFLIGLAIAGQTFFLFVSDNLKHFGALKAMGLSNRRIIGMVLAQAFVVGFIGYSLGIGSTAAFFVSTANITHLAGLDMSWEVMAGTGVAIFVIMVLTSLVSVRRLIVLEPAVVFRGN